MNDEEYQKFIDEYGDISDYIKDEVYNYKKNTIEFMDIVKLLFFTGLIKNINNKVFNKKINSEYKKYENKIEITSQKAFKNIKIFINKGIDNDVTKVVLKSSINKLLNQFELDNKSNKTADDRYLKIIKSYYKETSKTLQKEYIVKEKYLSEKVTQFDKVEKTVAYYNKNGGIHAYFDIASYDSMVYNTNLTRTAWKESLKDAIKRNYDVVYVEPHPFSCPMCQEWQGKFYSLSGTGQYPNIEVALFKNGGGLLHPNCTHIFRKKYDDDKENSNFSNPEWIERYKAKQRKQALELQRSRLRNDNKIYRELENFDAIDKNDQKIRKLNKLINEQKNLMN